VPGFLKSQPRVVQSAARIQLSSKAGQRMADHLVRRSGALRALEKALSQRANDMPKNIQKKLLTVDLTRFL
jgi:hypothetical protein